jgi:hypothetical protein
MTGILSPAVPAGVLGEGPPPMPFTGDQQQVGDLDPGGEHEPFRASVHTGCGAGAARTVLRGRRRHQAFRQQVLKLLDRHGQDFALRNTECQALDLPAARPGDVEDRQGLRVYP